MKKFLRYCIFIVYILICSYIGYIINIEYYGIKQQLETIQTHVKINTYQIDRTHQLIKYYILNLNKKHKVKEETTPEYYEKRTFAISCESGVFCTGVVLSRHLILTCKHCALVKSERNMLIFVENERATILAMSDDYDLALLFVHADLYKKGKQAIKGIKTAEKYQNIIIYGHPLSIGLTDVMTKGKILGYSEHNHFNKKITFQIIKDTIVKGNSGSGVYDEEGYLVGIIWGGYINVSSIGIMNTGQQVKEFLNKLNFSYLFNEQQ